MQFTAKKVSYADAVIMQDCSDIKPEPERVQSVETDRVVVEDYEEGNVSNATLDDGAGPCPPTTPASQSNAAASMSDINAKGPAS